MFIAERVVKNINSWIHYTEPSDVQLQHGERQLLSQLTAYHLIQVKKLCEKKRRSV